MASVILYRLESDLADELTRILQHDGHVVRMSWSLDTAVRDRDAHIVFAGGDGPDYRETVRSLVNRCPEVPVVLVNRVPENARWLDALELGASDYCGAPFESVQVRWLMESVLRAAPEWGSTQEPTGRSGCLPRG